MSPRLRLTAIETMKTVNTISAASELHSAANGNNRPMAIAISAIGNISRKGSARPGGTPKLISASPVPFLSSNLAIPATRKMALRAKARIKTVADKNTGS